MPVSLTYPGVYIEEIPHGVRTIVGSSTSVTAFVGRSRLGPVNKPVLIHSFGDFDRNFGGLWEKSPMSFAVYQYYKNGGKDAVIVRVVNETDPNKAATALYSLTCSDHGNLLLEASSPGSWGSKLTIKVDKDTKDEKKFFNLTVSYKTTEGEEQKEILRNLSIDPVSPTFITKYLEQNSRFLRVRDPVPTEMPENGEVTTPNVKGMDGGEIGDSVLVPESSAGKKGIYALEDADIFNLLCIPPLTFETDVSPDTYANAANYCGEHRAMLIIDPPGNIGTLDGIKEFFASLSTVSSKKNAAFFFPRIKMANPMKNNLKESFAPCGAVAGVFARTDGQRGVWKAPAGLEAVLSGVTELNYTLTDNENGDLNRLGINCLRAFPVVGSVIWGSRTLDGADSLASEWKYIPVRRLALYIEESLFRGTKWVVFEPNDEPLWAQIRLNIGSFMHNLFRQGAFQGKTPKEAYFVKCDSETTTQSDINSGIVNIVVGFAPLKPAEFVVIKIKQIAGEIQT
ncbi:MAG: phage tail sheath C-terminal domain-containing protein [Methanosarcina sp.]|jgi:phage tail sheath protein FI|nr:phage tail sheath C-terminal domain-containing protein [Methanosarcina sp.]